MKDAIIFLETNGFKRDSEYEWSNNLCCVSLYGDGYGYDINLKSAETKMTSHDISILPDVLAYYKLI